MCIYRLNICMGLHAWTKEKKYAFLIVHCVLVFLSTSLALSLRP